MRNLPVNLSNHIRGEILTLASCIRVTRRDGTVFGFTDHDRDLTIGGVTFHADTSFDATTVRGELGMAPGSMEAFGITSNLITETDLLAGRYDNCRVDVFVVDWTANPITEEQILFRGFSGDVEFQRGYFRAQLASLLQRLAQQIGRLTAPQCDVARLFDARCSPSGNTTPTANPTSFRFTRAVVTVTSPTELRFATDSQGTGYYTYGRVAFLTGANTGLERPVKYHEHAGNDAVITLQEAFPFAVIVGDNATLEAGCDRRAETCRARFGNVVNFRGFPHLPGSDRIIEVGRK